MYVIFSSLNLEWINLVWLEAQIFIMQPCWSDRPLRKIPYYPFFVSSNFA